MTFEIRKKTSEIWEHNWTDASDRDLILSAGYFTLTDDVFSLKTKSGGEIRTALLSEITVFDDTDVSTPETFTTALAFSTRMTALDYPYFKETSIGITNAGTSTLNAVAIFADTTGQVVKNSPVTIDPITGDTVIPGKLTVTGLIDPTGIVLDEQSISPFTFQAGKATLWNKNDVIQCLKFTNDTGIEHDLPIILSNNPISDGTVMIKDDATSSFVNSSMSETASRVIMNKKVKFNKSTDTSGAGIGIGQNVVLGESASALIIRDRQGRNFTVAQNLIGTTGSSPTFIGRVKAEVLDVRQGSDVQNTTVGSITWFDIIIDDKQLNEITFRALTDTTGVRLVIREDGPAGDILIITEEDDTWKLGDGFSLINGGDTPININALVGSCPFFDGSVLHFTLEVFTGTFDIKGDTLAFGGQASAFVPYFTTKDQLFSLNLLADGGGLIRRLTGDVAITAGTADVVGTGTVFNTELSIGESVQIREENFTVLSITDNTNFTLSANHIVGAGVGIGGELNAIVFAEENILNVKNFDGIPKFKIDRLGNLKHIGDRFESSANNPTHIPVLSGTTAQTLSRVDVYQKTSTSSSITNKQFTAGDIIAPVISMNSTGVFATGDIVLIEGTVFNDGLYEIALQLGGSDTATLNGVGGNPNVEDFTKDQIVTAVESGTITKVNVSVHRTSLTGTTEHGEGSTTPITFFELARVAEVINAQNTADLSGSPLTAIDDQILPTNLADIATDGTFCVRNTPADVAAFGLGDHVDGDVLKKVGAIWTRLLRPVAGTTVIWLTSFGKPAIFFDEPVAGSLAVFVNTLITGQAFSVAYIGTNLPGQVSFDGTLLIGNNAGGLTTADFGNATVLILGGSIPLWIRDTVNPERSGVYNLIVNNAGTGDYTLRRDYNFRSSDSFTDGQTFFVGSGTGGDEANKNYLISLTQQFSINTTSLAIVIGADFLTINKGNILSNAGFSDSTARTANRVDVYLGTAITRSMTNQLFVAGVAGVSNPTLDVDSGVLAGGDLVLITDTPSNNGLFEIDSFLGSTATLRGVGTIATVEDFTSDQLISGTFSGNIRVVNVSVHRTSLTGTAEHGQGSFTPILFKKLAIIDEVPTVVVEEFLSKNVRFFGELGLPTSIPNGVWTLINAAEITLVQDTVFGKNQQVINVKDTNAGTQTGIDNFISFLNWQNAFDFGAEFGGIVQAITPSGSNAYFFMGVGVTGVGNPTASTADQRFGAFFKKDPSTNFIVLDDLQGATNVILNGTGGVPLVEAGDYFEAFVSIDINFTDPRWIVNGIDVGAATFGNNSFTNDTVSIASGSSGGVGNDFNVVNFGITIYEESATKTLATATMQADIAQIFIPAGKRDYTIILPDGNPRKLGDVLTFLSQNVGGKVTLKTQNVSVPESLFIGLNEIVKVTDAIESVSLINTIQNANIYQFSIPPIQPDDLSPLFVSTADATVANTTLETTMIGTGKGNLTVVGNSVAVGDCHQFRIGGRFSAGANPTLQLRLKLETVVVGDSGAVGISNVTDGHWVLEGTATFRSIGVTGTISVEGGFTTSVGDHFKFVSLVPTIVDTTQNNTIDMTAQWGTASAGNTITAQNVSIIRVLSP